MAAGIAPKLLAEQVKSTAGWLWTENDPRAAAAVRLLDDVAGADTSYRSGAGTAHLALLLAAHWATVATFVPTDVDARIRHHVWAAIDDGAVLAAACDVVDEVARFDANAVSARVHHGLSGHDGEWLAVRAGAVGRAAAIGVTDLVERLASQIDAEIDREEAMLRAAFERGLSREALTVATIVAHNVGDLSRVAAEWPLKNARSELEAMQRRWVRLGHPDAPAKRPLFVRAGALNKAVVAHENHRFLALRKPRGLRASRELLLPIGPWLDGWGATIAKSERLDDRDRAEVVAALLEIHVHKPEQDGCLRAIAGMHHATAGGIERFVPDLPARLRKDALRGRVREALDIAPDRFDARIANRYRQALDPGQR